MLDSFWDLLWLSVMVFLFVAYLMILFQVITDLIRDREMPGVVRALWIIFLIVLPYLTALVYLVVRGGGMAERSLQAHRAAKDATDAYIREAAGHSPAQQIAEAKALLDAGAITPAEFDRLKAKALA